MSATQGNQIKETQTLYTAATKAEFSGDLDKAFKLYIKAAEQFLHLGTTTSTVASRDKCKSEAARCLDRAEKIRKRKKDVTPVARDPFSEREQLLVLHRSSSVNGVSYPLWDESQNPRRDTSQPKLSVEQTRQAAQWLHAGDDYVVCSGASSLSPEDVSQHIISDCSFCASIAVCIAHNHRFQSKLGTSALFPQGQDGLPIQSSGHVHSVRLLFNGAYRRVDIDDRLPHGANDSMMCMSTGRKRELWPSLLEKAYMKLMGGYEFPGSLSSADLYTLTGWIPEHIDVMSPHFEREKTWRRLHSSFKEGHCMVTIGTGSEIRDQAVESVVLLPAHCYAVIDMVDDSRGRTLVALDPWQDQVEASRESSGISLANMSLEDKTPVTSRVFEVSWDVFCATFNGLYLSWDPRMFAHQVDFHGTWKQEINAEERLPCQLHLTLELEECTRSSEVWILLSRHVTHPNEASDFIALSLEEGIITKGTAEHSITGEYTNNTQVLVSNVGLLFTLAWLKFQMRAPAAQPTMRFVVSYDGAHDNVGFTLSAYSCHLMTWSREVTLPYTESVLGKFTTRNAGGNPALPTFFINPQYHIRIHSDPSSGHVGNRAKKSRLRLSLRGDRHTPLNVVAIWSQGQRTDDYAHSDIALGSNSYSYGHASAISELNAGDYTVVVSSFEPRHTGPYILKLDCNTRVEVLSQLPPEGAGMYSKPVRGSWTTETAAGAPQFQRYKQNPMYKLQLSSQAELLIRLQLSKPDLTVALNVAIFRSTGEKKLGPLVATTGAYSDSVCGVLLRSALLPPGCYVIVPSTFTPGVCSSFRMMLYSTTAIECIPYTLNT